MKRFGFGMLLVFATLVLGGCFHFVLDTGFPATTQGIHQKAAKGYFWGLVPPPVVASAVQCRNGVSKVESRHSVANFLLSAVTLGIYTPMELVITCASPRSP